MNEFILKIKKYMSENDWKIPVSFTISIMSILFICVLCLASINTVHIEISLLPIFTLVALISGIMFIRNFGRVGL